MNKMDGRLLKTNAEVKREGLKASVLAYVTPGELNLMLEYLDDLRDSGTTNMFGAARYVADEFGLDRQLSRDILSYWMMTYGQEHDNV